MIQYKNRSVLIILIISLISSVYLLYLVSGIAKRQNFDDFALGDKTKPVHEKLNNQKLSFLNFTVDENTTKELLYNNKPFLLSFGNSQSDTINQYKPGIDHLFIYYLARKYLNFNVINLNAPNSNLQEMFLGVVNAKRIFGSKINTVFIPCVFDDTREDGIRTEIDSLIKENKSVLNKYPSGKLMIEGIKEDKAKEENFSDILLKYKAENMLNDFLEEHSKIYASRGAIRSLLNTQLYFFRNWVFGIKPTTKRKKIDVAYSRNLIALKDIASFCESHDIKLFFYIAPLRQDIEMPYVKSEYDNFKKDVSEIHQTYNLENIVPGKYWGETNGDWVDFMHFRGEGHILLAKELEKILKKRGLK